jgi:hypothetical protein
MTFFRVFGAKSHLASANNWIKLHVHYYFQRKIEKRAEHIQVETKFNSSKYVK